MIEEGEKREKGKNIKITQSQQEKITIRNFQIFVRIETNKERKMDRERVRLRDRGIDNENVTEKEEQIAKEE